MHFDIMPGNSETRLSIWHKCWLTIQNDHLSKRKGNFESLLFLQKSYFCESVINCSFFIRETIKLNRPLTNHETDNDHFYITISTSSKSFQLYQHLFQRIPIWTRVIVEIVYKHKTTYLIVRNASCINCLLVKSILIVFCYNN